MKESDNTVKNGKESEILKDVTTNKHPIQAGSKHFMS